MCLKIIINEQTILDFQTCGRLCPPKNCEISQTKIFPGTAGQKSYVPYYMTKDGYPSTYSLRNNVAQGTQSRMLPKEPMM